MESSWISFWDNPDIYRQIRSDFKYKFARLIFERLLIDLAPLPHDRTTIASFPLLAAKCSDVSRILVKDVPACRAEGGGDMDCFSSLRVKTRARIQIGK